MVQRLYSDLEELRKEVRRLRGELKKIAIGSTIIAPGNPGSATVPTAVDGALIRGNATPGWERLAASVPAANVRNVVGLDNGDVRPSWKTALASTTPQPVDPDVAGTPGTSLIFSHVDHKHPIETSEVDTTKRLAPDGAGGVEWSTGGSITGLIVYVPFGSEAVEGESFTP